MRKKKKPSSHTDRLFHGSADRDIQKSGLLYTDKDAFRVTRADMQDIDKQHLFTFRIVLDQARLLDQCLSA